MCPPMEMPLEGELKEKVEGLLAEQRNLKAKMDSIGSKIQQMDPEIRNAPPDDVGRPLLTEMQSSRIRIQVITTEILTFKQSRERYYLKAMNCPHHHRIFAAEPRSYRDLPLRLAEYGTCYRYEQSGELFGIMRVRRLNMNDAHIYCQPEKFAEEFNAVNQMYLKYLKIFGIEKYVMRFSTHDPARLTGDNAKFVNEPELWKQTEDLVRKVL